VVKSKQKIRRPVKIYSEIKDVLKGWFCISKAVL
jgi:hypothetical protein